MNDDAPWLKDSISGSLRGEALTWDEEMIAKAAVLAHRREAPKREREQREAEQFRIAVFYVDDVGLVRFVQEYLRVKWQLWRYACPIEDYFHE